MKRLGVLVVSLWSDVAWAAVPDHVGMRFNLIAEDRSIKHLDVSEDERIIAGVAGDGRVVVIDAESWATAKGDVCTARAVAIADRAEEGDYLLYVSCTDGTLHTLRWRSSGLSTFQVDGEDEVVELSTDSLEGVWRGSSGVLYALSEDADDVLQVHTFNPSTKAVDGEVAAGVQLLRQGFREGVIVRSTSGDIVYVAHGDETRGGNDFSQVQLSTGVTLSNAADQLANELDVVDVVAAPVLSTVPAGLWLADPDKGLWRWNGSTGAGTAISVTSVDASIKRLRALSLQYDEDRSLVESVLLFRKAASGGGGTISALPQAVLGQEPLAEFDVGFNAVDMVEGPYGYVFAGTDDGAVVVLTANPWVDALTLSPSEGEEGTAVEVSFKSDSAGSWKLYRGGDRTGSGTVIAEGELSEPGEVTTSFTVDDSFTEGETAIYAIVTDDDGSGHARAAFLIDNAPLQVSLSDSSVQFGNESLYIEFAALTASDIDHYDLYISTEAFSASDYATGGPTSSARDDGLKSPREVKATEGAARVQTQITNLDNNVSYYIAVRAVDAQGTEGPMSRVVVGMPRQTFTAGERTHEAGGPACASADAGGSLWGLLVAAGALALRRRSTAVLGLAVLWSAGGVAQADEEPRTRGLARFDRDLTPAWASFEFRHDFQHFGFKEASSQTQKATWETLQNAYAPWVSVLRLEAGPQFFRVVELDFGIGFMTRKGATLDSSDDASGEVARLQWFPLSLGGTLRAHIIDEQPIVPYGGAGIDLVFYREDVLDDAGAALKSERLIGSKNGWHWFVGGNILLDNFAPSRAARLEALTGINDSWLTIEYRSQSVGPNGSGFDFSGWALGIGLKLDY